MNIGILGNMGSGKSTSAEYIVKNYNYEEKFFAKPLKDIIQIMFQFDHEQLYGSKKQIDDPFWGVSPRKVMQFIGTELFRNQADNLISGIGKDFWIKVLERELIKNKNYVISDCRMQNEVNFIKNRGGIIVKIIRPTNRDVTTNIVAEKIDVEDATAEHITECGIDKVVGYDYIIINDGTKEELYKKLDDLIYSITERVV